MNSSPSKARSARISRLVDRRSIGSQHAPHRRHAMRLRRAGRSRSFRKACPPRLNRTCGRLGGRDRSERTSWPAGLPTGARGRRLGPTRARDSQPAGGRALVRIRREPGIRTCGLTTDLTRRCVGRAGANRRGRPSTRQTEPLRFGGPMQVPCRGGRKRARPSLVRLIEELLRRRLQRAQGGPREVAVH
jgi:hypothetical protein